MSQPILSLTSSADRPKTTPHLLPCRVHHTGDVEPVDAFWDPRPVEGAPTSTDGLSPSSSTTTSTAYFRGRKLQGKTVKLPAGYRGVVVAAASTAASSSSSTETEPVDEQEQQKDAPGESTELSVQADFDEVVIWAHEATADAAADPYVRGMEEWLGLADQVRLHPTSSPLTLSGRDYMLTGN